MSKRVKLTIAILIAISSFTVLVVLANEASTTVYFPEVYNQYGAEPTPTPVPKVLVTGFHPSDIPEEDYVMLMNNTGGTLDLTGWWLKAENQSGRYDFPAGFNLGSGQSVNVRSGVGTDTATNLYIGLPFSLWTVSNNCAYVRDINGTLQDKQCVGASPTPTASPTPSVYIAGFNPSTNPQNDYVIITNSTTQQFNLTGWWMKAESESGRYDFPTGFMLNAGATVNVRSGVGTDTTTDLFIGLPFSLWTVDYNCVYVRDADGNLQDKACVSDEPVPTETPTSSVYISGFNPSSIPEDDYVTIFNSATESFNLTGWWMKAESESGRYDFPTDFILTAGASVNVRTGVGTDTTTDLYIGGSYSLWTKANNCAYLRYSDGTLLDVQCVD